MKELQLIQSALKAPKGQTNTFGKYKYRSCEDILEAVKPLLAEHECHLTISDEIVLVGERYYVKAEALIYNKDNLDYRVSAYAREPLNKKGMDESQITGAASSYARKYALNGLFAIDDTKDADTMKPPVNGSKLPTRASVNGELLELKTIEEYTNYAKAFQKKHTGGVWVWSSNKRGNKSETWKQLFETHKSRVNAIPPVEANEHPDNLQKRFDTMVDTCSDWETYDLCMKMYDDNNILKVTKNLLGLNKLLDELMERLGER